MPFIIFFRQPARSGSTDFLGTGRLKSEVETNDLRAYSGIYKVDLIAETNTDPAYHESAVILIYADTRAVMYVPNTNGPGDRSRDYYGRIRLVKEFNGDLVGSFDLSPDTKVSRFTLYIYKKIKRGTFSQPSHFYGVYAGIDYLSENVIAGRIRLTKTDLSLDADPAEYKRLVGSIPIQPPFFQQDPDLLALFSGNKHGFDFIEMFRWPEGAPAQASYDRKPEAFSFPENIISVPYPVTCIRSPGCLSSWMPRAGQHYGDPPRRSSGIRSSTRSGLCPLLFMAPMEKTAIRNICSAH